MKFMKSREQTSSCPSRSSWYFPVLKLWYELKKIYYQVTERRQMTEFEYNHVNSWYLFARIKTPWLYIFHLLTKCHRSWYAFC